MQSTNSRKEKQLSSGVSGWVQGGDEQKCAQEGVNIYSRPECPFNYCDQEAPFIACKDQCRHISNDSQGNSEEAAFRAAMSKPAEVWYPCGCKASAGAPRHCPEHGAQPNNAATVGVTHAFVRNPECPKCGSSNFGSIHWNEHEPYIYFSCNEGHLFTATTVTEFAPFFRLPDAEELARKIADEWANGLSVTVEDAALKVLRSSEGK